MVLRGRRINNFDDFSLKSCSGAVDIWLLTPIFHTSTQSLASKASKREDAKYHRLDQRSIQQEAVQVAQAKKTTQYLLSEKIVKWLNPRPCDCSEKSLKLQYGFFSGVISWMYITGWMCACAFVLRMSVKIVKLLNQRTAPCDLTWKQSKIAIGFFWCHFVNAYYWPNVCPVFFVYR